MFANHEKLSSLTPNSNGLKTSIFAQIIQAETCLKRSKTVLIGKKSHNKQNIHFINDARCIPHRSSLLFYWKYFQFDHGSVQLLVYLRPLIFF